MTESHDVVIVGAGQAGLALSHHLSKAGREHVVLERGRIGQSWRSRWDSFCLVLPNWTIQLPGQPYEGPDPDGFMEKDRFVDHLRSYAETFHAPVMEKTDATSLEKNSDGGFTLRTSSGDIYAREVVLASGGYQKPHRPAPVEQFPSSIEVLDVSGYHNPQQIPSGRVLVIGSGQSGCQIAEELSLAGRDVYLACGRSAWIPRRIGDRDSVAWLVQTGFLEMTLEELPTPKARLSSNIQLSGRNGGHDLNFRTLQGLGVNLLGHMAGVADGKVLFAKDLADSVAFGDARYSDMCGFIREVASKRGVSPPEMPIPPPFSSNSPESVGIDDFSAAIVTCGFRPDYGSWVHVKGAFDEMGFPIQIDGSSTVVAGLHFMGVHFQRKRKSATLLGVAEDAEVLARKMTTGRLP